MIRLSITYSDKWRVRGYDNYAITKCGKIINTKTGRILKLCMKGYTKGYNIGSSFMTLKTINKLSYIPKEIKCPFLLKQTE